mgnify:CR=1 FL=1
MSLQDPIADLFTRIRNGQKAKKFSVVCQKSSFKVSILNLLVRHGYVSGFKDILIDDKPGIEVLLKYVAGEPAISEIVRKSKPSLRRYSGFDDIEDMYGHHGTVIVSTPKGVYSKAELIKKAKDGEKLGGEVVGTVI